MLDRIIELPQKQSFFLFGPRQTGKSTLIKSKYAQSVWAVNLLLTDTFLKYSKEPSLFRREVLEKIKSEHIQAVFIDEIQRVPALLNEVQYLMDEKQIQFILTGSSARKLKRGDANLLGGRAAERFLFPFVYAELHDKFDLNDVLIFGTLPSVFGKSKQEKIDTLLAYSHIYLKEEIQSEGIVRNLGGFSRFLDIAASQFGELLSFSNVARECQLPVRTVQSYYEILEDTLIGYRLMPWRKSLRKRLTAHPKFYLFDLGVTNAINHRLTGDLELVLKGRLFEQMVITEAYRMAQYFQSEAQLFFWQTNHGAEVDLVIEKHGKLIGAFEIKSSAHISSSHLSGLRSFREEHPNVPNFLICQADQAFELDHVKILPWQQFFLNMPKILKNEA